MGTIKIVLKANQPKKDGTIPILIRITVLRQVKYISTGYAVKEHQFREGTENWVVKHPDAKLINAAIEVKRAGFSEQLLRADIDEKDIDITDFSKRKTGKTFFWAVRYRLQQFEDRNQVESFERLLGKLNVLREAWGRDVFMSELNKYWVDKYISHRVAAGSKNITIKKDLSGFSGVLKAIDHNGPDPFSKEQSSLKVEPVNREKLTAEDIKSMEKTKMDGLEAVARDMFLFAFYTHGMRFESVATFTMNQVKGGVIRYRMNKGKKMREIEIHPKLSKIIERYKDNKPYLFPVVKKEVKDIWQKKNIIGPANTLINTYLKRVAIICGIDKKISSHIARHTFSYLSLQKGVSYGILKDALGHSNFQTTQQYLKSLSDKDINDAVRGLYD